MRRDVAIRVENLGKRYRIGQQRESYKSLRESLVNAAATPLRRLRGEQAPENNTFWALKDVSFEVKHGEVVGIIGRNGAGKSTLLKLLTRITDPTAGRVEMNGRVASLLEVGTGFHPELTGRENIYMNGAILGMTKREISSKFDEIVAFAEIEQFLDTPVKRYSSGMYVRLAFAVAAHLEPEILLVDEVLAVGDAQFQQKCLGKMGEVAKGGRTVLFVSHNMSAIERLCKSALYLVQGCSNAFSDVRNGIEHYFASIAVKERVIALSYPDVPDKPMQFCTVRINTPNKEAIDMAEEIVFNIAVLTRRPVDGAYVTINIFDQHDIPLYWTADISSKRFINPAPGRCTLVCHCPAYLLTPGRYTVNFGINSLGLGIIDYTPTARISFTIEDRDSLLASYGIKHPGVSAVPSKWVVDSYAQDT